jgi:hypothetical protein
MGTLVTKTCRTCEVDKPLDAFHRNKNGSMGRLNHCIDCRREKKNQWGPANRDKANESARRYREANRERVEQAQRKSKLMHQYGLTVEEYDEMLAAQGGVCAICKSDDPGHGKKNFCVDHNHDTGKVRGLLCKDCNTGLGMFGDSITALMQAANYLNDGDEG